MLHYRVDLETGKKKSESRTIFVRGDSIMDAYTVSSKIRYGRMRRVIPVSYEDYMRGVDKKYTQSLTKGN